MADVRMEINKDCLNRNLVSIHYPGVVKNDSKALETLGGIRTISSIYCGKNRRLELRMRPDDVFCKPTFATRRPVTAIILKMKIKKKKKEITSCEIIGHVTDEYKFTGLCDFQYLPTSKTENLYDKVVPRDLDLGWLIGECPFFLPPTAFARTDLVQTFNFSKIIAEEGRPNVIGRLMRKRYGCTKCVTFDSPDVPVGPKHTPGGKWSAKIVTKETLDRLVELFSTRPIFSKAAITCISKMPSDQLKYLLPCVAYFFTNGPWRSLWVRFGYDPRKDPSSRIYQTLDYRVKSHFTKEEKESMFKRKRETLGSPLSMKYSNQFAKGAAVIARNVTETNEKEGEKTEVVDHIFKPGVIPPSRQCMYQYCDLHVPEIQSMLDQLPMVDEQATCSEVHGWLPAGMSETCRDIMNKYIVEEVRRRSELLLSGTLHPQGNQPSESESSDE